MGIGLWLLEEYLAFRFGWVLWEKLPKLGAFLFAVFGVVGSGCGALLRDKNRFSVIRPEGMPFWQHAVKLVKGFLHRYLLHNTLAGLCLLLLIMTVFPAYAAQQQLFARIAQAVASPSAPSSAVQEKTASQEKDPPPRDYPASVPPQETPPEREEGALADRLILNTTSPFYLTEEERSRIFFLSGSYEVENWDSQWEIFQCVSRFVADCRSCRRPPNYDEADTPQDVQDLIALASQIEREMATSADLEQVIDLRTHVYLHRDDPGYPLAKLLRENFGLYGEACARQGKPVRQAQDLYGESLVWGMAALEYDVAEKVFCQDLRVMEERYMKIVLVTPEDSFTHHYALSLSHAFGLAAKLLEEQGGNVDALFSCEAFASLTL